MRRETKQREVDYQGLIEAALTIPGSTGNTYNRLYSYSMGNRLLFWMQGIEPQPVATYKRWQAIGRQVVKGAKAKDVLRPITIKLKDEVDDEGRPKQITKFKLVPAIFPLSDTEGEPLPPAETPDWSLDRALQALDITRIKYSSYEGNAQGYSKGRELAINEIATDPLPTAIHELAHIVLGHTVEPLNKDYQNHRGLYEFGAEATSYLALNELGELTEARATESRGYIQGWLRGQRPSDQAIRQVFKATDVILNAGYEQGVTEDVA